MVPKQPWSLFAAFKICMVETENLVTYITKLKFSQETPNSIKHTLLNAFDMFKLTSNFFKQKLK